jgi:hypothetical protein
VVSRRIAVSEKNAPSRVRKLYGVSRKPTRRVDVTPALTLPSQASTTHGQILTLFVVLHVNLSLHSSTRDTDILATVISVASAAAGFVYGASHREKQSSRKHERPTNSEGQDQSNSSDDEDSAADGDLSAVTAGFMQPCKLVRRFKIYPTCVNAF